MLLLRELRGLLAEVRQVALERRPLEQLPAALERLPQLLLGIRQALQRLLGPIGVEILERLLQLLQPVAQLGRERAVDLLSDLVQLPLPRGIAQPRRLRALPQRFERLLERLRLSHELLLRLRDTASAFLASSNESDSPAALARTLLRFGGAPAPGLRSAARAVCSRPPASRGRRDTAAAACALRGADLAHGRQPQDVLA